MGCGCGKQKDDRKKSNLPKLKEDSQGSSPPKNDSEREADYENSANPEDVKVAIDNETSDNKQSEPKTPIVARNASLQSRNKKNWGAMQQMNKQATFVDELAKATLCDRIKTPADKEIIENAFKEHHLFSTLTDRIKNKVIGMMQLAAFNAMQYLFKQGNPGRYVFVLAEGLAEIHVNNKVVRTIKQGETVGEKGLQGNHRRTASVLTKQPSKFWYIDGEIFQQQLKELNSELKEQYIISINKVPIFDCLSPAEKDQLAEGATKCVYTSGKDVIREGDAGNEFYMILKGTAEVIQNKKPIRKMQAGDFFGEQALIYNHTRTATIRAVDTLEVFSIDRTILLSNFGERIMTTLYKNSIIIGIEKNSSFGFLRNDQVDKIVDEMEILTYKSKELVVGKGEIMGSFFLIVLKGRLRGEKNTICIEFCCLGDLQMASGDLNKVFDSNIYADEDCQVAKISLIDLERALGGSVIKIKRDNEVEAILQRVHLFRDIDRESLSRLVPELTIQKFSRHDIIFSKGDEATNLFIIKEGEVSTLKADESGITRRFSQGQYFGERSLIINENRSRTCRAETAWELWSLTKSDFESLVDESVIQKIKDNLLLADDSIKIENLELVDYIGHDGGCHTYICRVPGSTAFYSLKTYPKQTIEQFELHQAIKTERDILLDFPHQFMIKLVKWHKDAGRYYLLLEHIQGMDFYDTMTELNILNENQAQFYTICLLMVLEHLHENNICIRNLKPEAVLIDGAGYPKLSDFSESKVIADKTQTAVGSPHYTSPEMIRGSGYDCRHDLWSLGCMVYEMLCGKVPFGEEIESPHEVYNAIEQGSWEWPQALAQNTRSQLFVEKLLNRVPQKRGTAHSLKDDNWFSNISYTDYQIQNIAAPYTPEIDPIQSNVIEGTFLEILETNENKIKVNNRNLANMYNVPSWDSKF